MLSVMDSLGGEGTPCEVELPRNNSANESSLLHERILEQIQLGGKPPMVGLWGQYLVRTSAPTLEGEDSLPR